MLLGQLLTVKQAAELLFGDQNKASIRRTYRIIESYPDSKVQVGKRIYLNHQKIKNMATMGTVSLFDDFKTTHLRASQKREEEKKKKRGLPVFFKEMQKVTPKGLTKRKLALKLGRSPATLSRWIAGTQGFTHKNAKDIINFYYPYSKQWTWDLLFSEEEPPTDAAERLPITDNKVVAEKKQVKEVNSNLDVREQDKELNDLINEVKQIVAKKNNINPQDCKINISVNFVL